MSNDPNEWVKASRSGGNGQCVEMRQHQAAVEVRDTKDAGLGPSLRLTSGAFASWVSAAKNGEFDHFVS